MKAIRKILLAVKDPDARRQPGIEKSIHIARSLGASLELFHAISSPVFLDLQPLTGTTLAQLRDQATSLSQQRLEKFVAAARKAGVEASCNVTWDYPPHEAIVRRALAMRADIVIAEIHQGRRFAPWLVRFTDWELLRTSPVPVLLIKNPRRWNRPSILAAVDPTHARAKPSALDENIIARAQLLARGFRGAVTAMHANQPPLKAFTVSDPSIGVVTLAAAYEEQKTRSAKAFARFAARHGVPAKRRCLIEDDPVHALPQAARKVRADVVVMGAVSRSGIQRLFIGNTAEQVLQELNCDVLVVKPARFASKVGKEVRGMRVAAPSPYTPLPV
jgi:universal stress protein E